jgi:hypothetical protein
MWTRLNLGFSGLMSEYHKSHGTKLVTCILRKDIKLFFRLLTLEFNILLDEVNSALSSQEPTFGMFTEKKNHFFH